MDHIFVVHIAKVNIRSSIGPVTRILEFETHLAHVVSNLFIAHWLSVDEGLLNDNLKISVLVAPKAKNSQSCFREIGIMECYAVEGKNGLNKIIEANGFNQRRSMIINFSFTTLGNLFAKNFGQLFIYAISPYSNCFCPLFNYTFLLRSKLALSLVVAEC